ncbi:MAG: CHAD domain-containing protein [Kiritimatiellae bacterium]|nr:CHAD domain-containing protein [Kiritimatiellia bacterium]MDD5521629.1 CHAD domain-containing protein [Kiritimatiellia bacterium]
MKRRLTDLELCEKYDNEIQHTEYVTRIALKLFDRTKAVTGLSQNDKRLLETTCRLHDVSYSENGKNHAYRSAEIVLNEGLSGFTSAERAIIAGAILLHSGRRCRVPAQINMPGFRDREKMLKIAAYLRIADGLDHGHIQSSSIISVKANRTVCEIVVREDIYSANIELARMKADLWESVFKIPVRILHVKKEKISGPRFGTVLTGRESLIEYARKLVCILVRLADDNVEGSIMGVDPECLHDLRVTLRRTKAALRFFKPVLKNTSAGELRQSITKVCDQLSLARDSQVWMEFLREFEAGHFGAGKIAWEDYFSLQQSKNDQCLEDLRHFLQSEEFKKPFRQVSFFARIEIPRLERERGRRMAGLKEFISRRFYKAYEKLPRLEKPFRAMNIEELHAVRRQCRRVRYAAEFASPALGRKALIVEKKLNGVTDVLGKIHDIDVYLQIHAGNSLVVSTELRRHLASARRKAMKKTIRAWRDVNSQRFHKTVASICRIKNKDKADK